MPLFRRRHDESAPAAPVAPVVEESQFASAAIGRGWQPAGPSEFDSDMLTAMSETTHVFAGHGPRLMGVSATYVSHPHDIFRADRDGRKVIVANAVTNVQPGLPGTHGLRWVSVCSVEIPGFISLACVQPRALRPSISHIPEHPTGDAAFDERYLVLMTPSLPEVEVTPVMRRLISAREDWIFRVYLYHFTAFGKGSFESVDEMAQRIDDVLAVVAELPSSLVPTRVDHSQDDLIVRINKLESVDDALAFFQQLTPAERESLAKSDTPLAGFADVKTPEEAIALFQSLDPAKQFQILSMFERADGGS